MSIQQKPLKRDDVQYREAIIRQALHDFHERGIKGVTMSQVSEELHISKRTLYEIYKSKEELILECLRTKQEFNHKQMTEIVAKADNVLEAILRIFRLRLDDSQHINPQFLQELQVYTVAKDYFAKNHKSQRAEAVAFLQRGIAEGVFEPAVDFEIVYDMVALITENIFTLNLLNTHTLEDTFATTILTYIRGCTTDKGRGIIDNWLKEQKLQKTI